MKPDPDGRLDGMLVISPDELRRLVHSETVGLGKVYQLDRGAIDYCYCRFKTEVEVYLIWFKGAHYEKIRSRTTARGTVGKILEVLDQEIKSQFELAFYFLYPSYLP